MPPASAPSTSALAQPIPQTGISHTVQKGQTLWRIAKTYGVDLEEIVRLNKIPDSASIEVGQTLAIPASARQNTESNAYSAPASSSVDFTWPARGKIIAPFRQKIGGVANKGIDISLAPRTPILAARDGRVAFAGELPGYGPTIILDHHDGFSTVYCHLAETSWALNSEIKQGQTIGHAGDFSASAETPFHFEIRKKHKPQNPLYYLD